jgi:protein O-GlcNAc transferase
MSRRHSSAHVRRHLTAQTPVTVVGPTPPNAIQEALALYNGGDQAKAQALCRLILKRQAHHAGALTLLGIMMAQARRAEEAAELFGRAAAQLPNDASAHNNHGNALRDLGRHISALACYDRALALLPSYAEAHYNRAVLLHDLKRFADAVAGYDRAIALKPDYAAAYNNRGAALQELSYFEEAAASYDRALALQPAHPSACNNRGAALLKLKRFEPALASFERALALRADFAEAHNNRGVALQELERFEDAVASYERAIGVKPDYAEAHNNRGTALRELSRTQDALAAFERAIAIKADYAEAHNNRGMTLRELRRFDEALAGFERALAIKPEYPQALLNRGATLHDLRRFHEALASYERALAVKSDYAQAYRNQALTLQALRRPDEAAASYERALALTPNEKYLRGIRRHARMQLCDWTDLDADLTRLTADIEGGREVISPFAALSLFDSPALQRRVASLWTGGQCRLRRALPPLGRHAPHDKVRVGYFSADFRNHAVSALAAELFETHDRSRFELTAFSLGTDVRDALRERVERAFDRFIPVFDRSDEQVAALARELEIDIAVDLGGYTQDSRPLIFAQRAAPIQVSYLGYLGSMGAQFIDYLLADEVIVPPEQRRHYTERIAYLPSYQVNDTRRPVSSREFTRAELGLPHNGVVFCCFNANYKLTPQVFASWMRILEAVPGSCLLLHAGGPVVRQNLHQHASRLGVDPVRVVFADRIAYADYLARYRVADLFLDTLPYNAGTTASDALWMGLPVLTCAGESFAGRVAASLLTAVGLPELIAADRVHYESLAVELARAPERVGEIRRKLAAARTGAPLFDTPRFTRSLEALYQRMYRRHHLGLRPEHLALDDGMRR